MSELYTELAQRLPRGASRAILGLLRYRNLPLQEYLRTLYERLPGEPGSFLADPVFEATFGWKPAQPNMEQLAGNLLHTTLIKALANPPKKLVDDYAFPEKRRPYQHQWVAWKALIEESPPRSLLVSSGTGSGKTECFLIPILNDLATEVSEKNTRLTGVRALFLYPLNALIKSQKERLAAWSEPFDEKIRWCLYNGDTPQNSPPRRQMEWQSEVVGRDVLREDPPPILVTNATMLEYMLVRNVDRPIIDQSQGKLRWIVIDEAHSYLGSQAAELTLLLRRVLLAFGCQPDQVHFIATSATIGSGEGAKHQLQKFLADIAGVDPSRVTVVTGEREIPELRSEFSGQHLPLPQPSTLQQMTPDERYGALASCPQIRQMRKRLAASAARLTDLMSILKWKESPQDRLNLLALLDLCASARHGENGPLLPLRGHFFQRGQPGLWACSNAQCEGRVGTCLDAAEWPFGAVFTDRREHCSYCGYPVFELYQCGDCGEEVLAATQVYESAEDWLHPLNITEDVDEFQLDIEDLPAEEETENETEASAPSIGLRRLVVAGGSGQSNDTLSPDGLLGATGDEVISVSLQLPGESGRLQCPRCGGEERRSLSMSLFRPVRIGAPFLLQTAIPELLKHLPSKQTRSSDNPLPLQGRNLLAFTDSRQGTARIAARLQQESERNYVRSLLYHKLGELAESTDGRDVKKLKKQVKELEGVSQGNPVFQQLLEETKKKLADKQSPQIALLSWNESVDFLMGDRGFNRFVIPPLRDLTLELTDRQVTELCLWREFLFRPRNQFSLEGMGLVRLNYPELDNIAEAPAALRHLGVNVEEWRDFLQVVLDIIVRGWKAVSIPRDMLRWTGYLGVASDILPPGQPRTGWDQHGWPSAKNTMGRRSRLIRLITYAFQWDPANEIHQELIEEIINAIWIALKPLLSASEGGTYYLDLPRKAQLSGVHDAWLCPVTRRLLPITFKGLTPYLPLTATDELAKCERVEMPRLPAPFWPESEEKAREWLETDEKVRKLRSMGAWSDLNDRIAGFSPYFRSVEHSAQIKGNLLTRREKEFKEGRINLLSCSTTMEMGVDIGGLSAVAMNNVPPHPANFLQRAGRAGRRGEKSALSFTLCKSTPQGEAVFNNPLWAFTTALSVPQVALQSGRIIQRHVNALSLTQFLVQNTNDEVFKLNCGWFFNTDEAEMRSSPSLRFQEWCREGMAESQLKQNVDWLCHGSSLAGIPADQLLTESAMAMERLAGLWKEEYSALEANLEEVKTRQGNSRPEKAIRMQLERLEKEYLLAELATRGFLPGYGFPTGVVSLLTSTMETIGRNTTQQREDNRVLSRGSPSRPIAQALRDYAPGTDTTLDGRVYRSAGVTLNWHLPAAIEGGQEIQALRWVWRCHECGGTGTRPYRPEQCPHCGENDPEKLSRNEYLEPAGFAVDIRDKTHGNVNTQQYLPVRDPLISVQGAVWMSLPNPTLGHYRSTGNGHIFHRSDGLHGLGYSLCLRCGRSESLGYDGNHPRTMDGHKRLRGGRDNDREQHCPGNDELGAIKDGLLLGASLYTDIFELQLCEPETGNAISPFQAYSIAVVLRRALCRSIGIEQDEIGIHTEASRGPKGESARSIFLYDTASGGAGYVTQVAWQLPALLEEAAKLLECHCDKACQACLLTHDTQHHIELLDRRAAQSLLSANYLDALRLPNELKVFGEQSKLELEPLSIAIQRELQYKNIDEFRFYLGGRIEDWEPLQWLQSQKLEKLRQNDIRIILIADSRCINLLTQSQSGELAAVMEVTGASLLLASGQEMLIGDSDNALPLVLEMGGVTGFVRWAATGEQATVPGETWGTGTEETRFLITRGPHALSPISSDWKEISPAGLRHTAPGLVEINIHRELDGLAVGFGQRAWKLICEKDEVISQRLASGEKIVTISYSDRYVKSPLVLLLLFSFFHELMDYPGGLGEESKIQLITELLKRDETRNPYLLFHDWQDRQVRRELFEQIFGTLGEFRLIEKRKQEVPHARTLTIQWKDGENWTMRLDQGLGYWRLDKRVDASFPFERDSQRQLQHLLRVQANVVAQSIQFPTLWYCGQLLRGDVSENPHV